MPNDMILGSKNKSRLIIASKTSKFYPQLFKEFSHIRTAIILQCQNDFQIYDKKGAINVFEFIAASMDVPDGNMMLLNLIAEYIKENLIFYDVHNKGSKKYAPWWNKFIDVISIN